MWEVVGVPALGGQGERLYFLTLASKWCILAHLKECSNFSPSKLEGDRNKYNYLFCVTVLACNNKGTTLEINTCNSVSK